MSQAKVVASKDGAGWRPRGADDCVDVEATSGGNTAGIRVAVVDNAESMQTRSAASLGSAELSLACP